ncbi:hypothetical protein ADL32_25050 [Streptomyces albidoflavus]|nr:hypothetical protein ADL32_25050 [Streptomyces albidoflavus]PKA36472.1 hypothetical protein SM8_020870 [Streptomyces sp. SM8]
MSFFAFTSLFLSIGVYVLRERPAQEVGARVILRSSGMSERFITSIAVGWALVGSLSLLICIASLW